MASAFSVLHDHFHKDTIQTVVGMSVYESDRFEWIKQAAESILQQTYGDFLFVIVIDGEIPVRTMNLIKDLAFEDCRLVIAQNEENIGLAASMNNIIAWAEKFSPSFFVRMDADDVSMPNRLERQINYLIKHKNISVLGSALTEVNEEGQKVGARVMPAGHRQIVHLLPRRCTMNHPTVVIRFDVFRNGFTYDPSLKNTQDYFLWITLAKNGYIFRNLKDRLLHFRRVNNFYKRRGLGKSINEYKARLYAMRTLKRITLWNFTYATAVLALRLMPSQVVKLAYKVDRHILERFIKH
ncbi:glycosyltransferase [Alteromonas antoniana]|uniref:glycosyltransferase n=1 Tax=Alteromonas antoniana TaxID=2803813 RepID=UPI001C48FC97|nr:glycosyltransferase [Alteromonas antoniana]